MPGLVPATMEALSNGKLSIKCIIVNQIMSPWESPCCSALQCSRHPQVLVSRLELLLMYNTLPVPSCRCATATTSSPPRTRERESHSVVSDSLRPHGLYSPWNSPGQNTGLGSLSVLQGIFPTQVSCLAGGFFTSWATREAQEYWSGYPFSSGSSRPRNWTGESHIIGRIFTSWAIRDASRTHRAIHYLKCD